MKESAQMECLLILLGSNARAGCLPWRERSSACFFQLLYKEQRSFLSDVNWGFQDNCLACDPGTCVSRTLVLGEEL